MLTREEFNNKIVQLWPQVMTGNAHAISAFIALAKKDFHSLAKKFLVNAQDVNAVVNEAFIKILDNAKKIKDDCRNPHGWMRTVVVNACFDHIKKNKNEISLETLIENNSELLLVPEEDIIEQIHTRDCLDALDKVERTILILYSQKYTLQEICKETGLSIKKVRIKLAKAKENFIIHYEKGKN